MKIFEGLSIINKKDRKKFIKISFLQILKSLLEVISITSLIPLIYLLVKRDQFLEIYNNKVKSFEKINLQFENFDNLLIFLLISLFCIFFTKTVYSFICFKYEIKFQQKLVTLLSTELFGTYLNLDFEKINLRQKNEIVRNLNSEINHYVKFYIQPLYLIINELCKIIGISILLFVYNPYIFLIGFSILIIIFLVFKIFFEKKTNEIGEQRLNYSSLLLKYIQEGIDSLKEIKLTRNKNYFKNLFNNILIKNAKVILRYNLILYYPKNIIELISFTSILFIIFISFFLFNEDFSSILITLAIFCAALFKLLPSLNMTYQYYTQIMYSKKGIDHLKKEFKDINKYSNIISEKNNLPNINTIKLENLSYKYPHSTNYIFENLNLEFYKGKIYGISGPSGSGKSTFVNIIMGFLNPQIGKVIVNNKYNIIENLNSWYQQISYVPQKIFLTNDTIKKNIAFAEKEDKINSVLINKIIQKTKIDFINSNNGIEKKVGQDGVFFSEGQRQRIGIARSLYHDRKVIFFDEFTSALDKDTEEKILNNVRNIKEDKIIFIISHSNDVLKFVDNLIEIDKGKITLK